MDINEQTKDQSVNQSEPKRQPASNLLAGNPAWKKKGKSPNPKGKPKGLKSIKTILEHFGKFSVPEKILKEIQNTFPQTKKMNMNEAIYFKAYTEALKGEEWAIAFIADRTEGKALQTIKTEGPIINNTFVADKRTKENLKSLGAALNG